MAYITSGPVVGFELVADGAITRWRQLIGPTDSFRVRAGSPYPHPYPHPFPHPNQPLR